MKVLFISRKRPSFEIMPFIKSQADSLIDNGVELEHYLIKNRGIKAYIKAIPELRKLKRSKNFDVIHAHYSYSVFLALLWYPKVPIVVSFMGADVYGSKGIEGKQAWKSHFDVLLAKAMQFLVDAIIVKSQNLYNAVLLKTKAIVIPNGVNFETFRPMDQNAARQRCKISTPNKLILFLGHPTYVRKNFKLLQQAVALSDENWEIINPYPIDPVEIPYYINSADLLVLTSLQEGSPNVIKEAMACNCPIVSTDVGDVSEIIKNTDGCYLTGFEAEELIENVKKALAHGKPTTGRVDMEHLEINKIAQRIIGVYESVIK